jgi:hypothetical protein
MKQTALKPVLLTVRVLSPIRITRSDLKQYQKQLEYLDLKLYKLILYF